MGATEGSAAVPVMGGDLQETTELNLFFHRLDAVDPSHPPPRPSSDASPIAGSSPTPLLNPPSSATSQMMLSGADAAQECLQVQKAWAPNCLKDVLLSCGTSPSWWQDGRSCSVGDNMPGSCDKKTSIQGLTVTTDVALTSPAMKALEMLVLKYLWSLVGPSLDLLQFPYPSCIGVEDAIIYPLQRHLQTPDKAGTTVRVPSFDFSSAVTNIRPAPGHVGSFRNQPITCWAAQGPLQGTALSPFLR